MGEPFELVDNQLTVRVDLDLSADEAFTKWSERLAKQPGNPLILDLREVGFIGSAFFGHIFVLNCRARRDGRELVIRVPKRLHSIMELLGLPQLMTIEVVDNPT